MAKYTMNGRNQYIKKKNLKRKKKGEKDQLNKDDMGIDDVTKTPPLGV